MIFFVVKSYIKSRLINERLNNFETWGKFETFLKASCVTCSEFPFTVDRDGITDAEKLASSNPTIFTCSGILTLFSFATFIAARAKLSFAQTIA